MPNTFDEIGAAHYLGGNERPISRRTMQRLRQTGDGPDYYKVGDSVRYTQEALDAYRLRQTRRSTSEAA